MKREREKENESHRSAKEEVQIVFLLLSIPTPSPSRKAQKALLLAFRFPLSCEEMNQGDVPLSFSSDNSLSYYIRCFNSCSPHSRKEEEHNRKQEEERLRRLEAERQRCSHTHSLLSHILSSSTLSSLPSHSPLSVAEASERVARELRKLRILSLSPIDGLTLSKADVTVAEHHLI